MAIKECHEEKGYGKTKLLWFGDKDKTLNYTPAPDEMVMTVHRWFAAKACPGDYLYSRHGMIAQEVTRRLTAKEGEDMSEEKFYEMFVKAMEKWRGTLRDNDCGEWSRQAREYCINAGIFAGGGNGPDGQPNYMWADLLTREQAAALMFRLAQVAGLV